MGRERKGRKEMFSLSSVSMGKVRETKIERERGAHPFAWPLVSLEREVIIRHHSQVQGRGGGRCVLEMGSFEGR